MTKEVRKVLQEEEEGGTVKPLMDQIEWASDSICDCNVEGGSLDNSGAEVRMKV